MGNTTIDKLEALPKKTEFQDALLHGLKEYDKTVNNSFKSEALSKIYEIIKEEITRAYTAGFSDGYWY